ncbi:MAG: hypothetical protein ACO3EZ_19220 [Prochlorotrichaceae cyanobacterium]
MATIDNYEEAIELVEALKATLPFEVYPEKRSIKKLKEQDISIEADEKLQVIDIVYTGDMGGILFRMETPTSPLLMSVTHVIMLSDHPLCERVEDYQNSRTRKLMLQNKRGFAELLADRSKKSQKKKRKKFS